MANEEFKPVYRSLIGEFVATTACAAITRPRSVETQTRAARAAWSPATANRAPAVQRPSPSPSTGEAALHPQMLEKVVPPSMLVDETYRAVHLSEHAGRFLQLSGGSVSTNATEMVREELRFDLRTALHRAFERGEATLNRSSRVCPGRLGLHHQARASGQER
jgi:hypothetical protein